MNRTLTLLFAVVLLGAWGCNKEQAETEKNEAKAAEEAPKAAPEGKQAVAPADKGDLPTEEGKPEDASKVVEEAASNVVKEAPTDKPADAGEETIGKDDKEAEKTVEAEPADEATEPKKDDGPPVVIIETSMGTFKVEIYPEKTPITVANFLRYVDDKFYDGSIFHRVVKGFVIQGGGFDESFARRLTREPIENEAASGLPSQRGTIAMARTRERNSATSQFYVNLRDNAMLNYRGESPAGWGYCTFGKVIEGMDVVDKIGAVQTGSAGPFPSDVPQTPVTIISVRRAQ